MRKELKMNNEDMKKIADKHSKRLSPLKSIKKYCKLMCCCNDWKSWKYCSFTECFLYKYRLGVGNRGFNKKHSSGALNFRKNKVIREESNHGVQGMRAQ